RRGDASCDRRGGGSARGARMVADPARLAVLVSRTGRGSRAREPHSARRASGLRPRVERARAGGGGAPPPSRCHRAPAARDGRARVGTCTERPLQRSTALLEAGAAARHARRPQVLSPRHGGTLSRQRRCCEDVVPPRTRAQPTLLPAVGAGRGEVRGVKRLVFLAAVLAALVLPVAASAHPLGNFTVNRFSRIEVSGSRIYVRYVLDLAEIPT